MDAKPESTAPGEVYVSVGNVQATIAHINEAISWLEATKGINSPFTIAMDSRKNPLALWSRHNSYQGLKKSNSSTVPSKQRIAEHLRGFLDFRTPDELPYNVGQVYPEGASKQIAVNQYERNPKARAECLALKGYNCVVCDFSFEERYGLLGQDYIHVHHLKELSKVPPDYQVDPKDDLVPICPNCHAMVHRETPALTPFELKQRLLKSSMAV